MSDTPEPSADPGRESTGPGRQGNGGATLQELALSEARYRALVEGSSDFIYVLDTEGRFTFANAEVAHLLGYSPDEVIGRHYTDVLHPEDVGRVGRAFHERRTGDRAARRMEVRLKSRAGVTRDVELDVRHFSFSAEGLYRGDNFVGTHGVARDITERKYQEAKRLVLQRVREAVWSMISAEDIQHVLEAIRQGLDAMGVTYGQCAVNVIDPSEPPILHLYSSRETEGIAKSGEWMVTEAAGYPSRTYQIWLRGATVNRVDLEKLDPAKEFGQLQEQFGPLRSAVDAPFSHGTFTVTGSSPSAFSDRDLILFEELAEILSEGFRRVEDLQQLALSERRYRTLVETPNFVVMLIDPEGNYLYVSPQIEGWLGYSPRDFYEDAGLAHGLTHPDDQNGLAVLSELGASAEEAEFRWRHQSGQYVWASCSVFPIYENPEDEQIGRVGMYQVVLQDVTERKRAEDAVHSSLEEKEVLLKEIHHRVKNNLQIISSLLHLQSARLDDNTLDHAFEDSQHRIRSMALIHEELYKSEDLAHIDFPSYAERLVSNLFDSFGSQVRGIGYETRMDPSTLTIDQAIPLGLIINELVSNALKYAFDDGTGAIRVELSNDGDRLELRVEDDGVGLPQELLDGGLQNPTTLGLKLVNSLVGQLKGEIFATCEGGTAFHVSLPATA